MEAVISSRRCASAYTNLISIEARCRNPINYDCTRKDISAFLRKFQVWPLLVKLALPEVVRDVMHLSAPAYLQHARLLTSTVTASTVCVNRVPHGEVTCPHHSPGKWPFTHTKRKVVIGSSKGCHVDYNIDL